jgi:hypothetical protein
MRLNQSILIQRDNVKNIIISGTNFWNPGDDFVRDGIVRILREIFEDARLNLMFYNFNEDFLPQSKFKGISNMVGPKDLGQLREHVHAIVICGLSAGREIKDLYGWIVNSQLTDRVFLIGAGYENDYVASYIASEPEATIFKSAQVITGRTKSRPDFIDEHHLPYFHINCPAILSVKNEKSIPKGKKIEKIAFSIQLPQGIGIPNHWVDSSNYLLALETLKSLYSRYDISIIAHHKTEYFHFLNQLKKSRIPIIFSSFYQDLYDEYQKYDLVISTRLHACLFANGHGIPAIIINDTDRHTHCVDGFPHSVWVNSNERFWKAFNTINQWDLCRVSKEAADFKKQLMKRYVAVLAEPLIKCCIEETTGKATSNNKTNKLRKKVEKTATLPIDNGSGVKVAQALRLINCEKGYQKSTLSQQIYNAVSNDLESKKRVLDILERLEKDYWLDQNIINYKKIIQNHTKCFDSVSFLNWYSEIFKPQYYLEIGVRRGRSMAQVMCQSSTTKTYGFDMWVPEYSSVPENGISTQNPGPAFVLNELAKLGAKRIPALIKGNSHETLAAFWTDSENPKKFDLIFVDGDHTYAGAKQDLEICFEHLAEQGVLLFDDLNHPAHPDLKNLWNEIKARYSDCLYIEDSFGMGTGVAFKPPFDFLGKLLFSKSTSVG